MIAQAVQAGAVDTMIPADEDDESVSVKTFSLDGYTEEEIRVFVGQLVEAKHRLSDIEQLH